MIYFGVVILVSICMDTPACVRMCPMHEYQQ